MSKEELAQVHADWESELKELRVGIPEEKKKEMAEFAKLGREITDDGQVPWKALIDIIDKKFGHRVPMRTLADWVEVYCNQ